MTRAPPVISKIPTKSPQPARGKAARPVGGVEAECRGLGLAPFTHGGDWLEGQQRLTYAAPIQSIAI
jgi:hypothetical protein